MRELLFHYYMRLYEVLFLFALVAGAGATAFWIAGRHWQGRYIDMEQSLIDRLRALYGAVDSAIAHRWSQHLDFISNRSTETLKALREDQDALRVKQTLIRAKANELLRHANNIMRLFDPQRSESPRPEVLDVSKLLYGVLATFFVYADDKQVTLMPDLAAVEPTVLDGDLTVEAFENIVHNAIKYSSEGRVVKVTLSLGKDAKNQSVICVRVRNWPTKVIPEKDRESIFELRKRADGLIEPGQGLGLYIARSAARLQKGDVILVTSNSEDGTIFEIVLPYTEMIALEK